MICGADSSFVVKVDPKLYSYVGCVCVDPNSEAVSKVDADGAMTRFLVDSCDIAMLHLPHGALLHQGLIQVCFQEIDILKLLSCWVLPGIRLSSSYRSSWVPCS